MARNRGTHHVSTVKHGDWSQTAARVAGAGTGTANVPVALVQSGSYSDTAGHTTQFSIGGDAVVELGVVERVATFGGIVKDPTLIGKAFRGTSMVTAQQFLTFLISNDMGLATTLTDAWIKSLKLNISGRGKALTADYEVWALREAAGTYAAQGVSTGWGPMMGAHLTTATIEGSAIAEFLSFELSLDNGFGWDDNLVVATTGNELEHVDFLDPMPEVITARLVCGKPIAEATDYLKELTLVQDIDIVLVFTIGAHTATLTLTNFYAVAREHTLGPGDSKYTFTLDIRNALGQGSATWAVT